MAFFPAAGSSSSPSGASPDTAEVPAFLSRILISRPLPAAPTSSPSPSTSTPAVPQPLYLPPPAIPDVPEDLIPPENFAVVCKGVYRCGFPKKRNFRFMETLGLRTVL